MTISNKQVVRAFTEEVLGRGKDHLLPTLISADYVLHLSLGDHYGADGTRIDIAAWREGFADLTLSLEDLLGEGDRVVRRFVLRGTHSGPFLGFAATGNGIEVSGIAIDRLHDGLIQESWMLIDLYGLVQRLNGERS